MSDQHAKAAALAAARHARLSMGAAIVYVGMPDGTCAISTDEAVLPDSRVAGLLRRAATEAEYAAATPTS